MDEQNNNDVIASLQNVLMQVDFELARVIGLGIDTTRIRWIKRELEDALEKLENKHLTTTPATATTFKE